MVENNHFGGNNDLMISQNINSLGAGLERIKFGTDSEMHVPLQFKDAN